MRGWEGTFVSRKREYALVLLFFLLLSILFTWPLIFHLHNGVVGGASDPLLNTWIISWNAKTIFTHPTHLFQANILYPSRDVLAYSEHLFTLGVIAVPIYYATGNPILTYNLLLFLGFVLSAFGCYLLIKELTGSRWGALAGGIFFAFCPFKISKLEHIHIFFSAFLPFMFLYLYRYMGKGGKRNLLLFGIFFLTQSLVSWHYLVFCALGAGLLWLWTAVFSRGREAWLRLAWVVAVLAIAVAAIVPFSLPYLRAHARLPGFERTLVQSEYFAANVGDYLAVERDNLVYGNAPPFIFRKELESDRILYPGLVIIVLALAGLFIRRRQRDESAAFDPGSFHKGALFFAILTSVGVLLTLGPKIGGVSDPLYTVLYHLGIFKLIRFPSRFYILAALGLAVLAGYGTAKVAVRVTGWRKSLRAGRLAGATIVILLLVELATFNLTVYPVPVWGEVPEVYSWLSKQGEVRVIELPSTMQDFPREGMLIYLSTYHWKEMANGYSGYIPFFYRRIFTEMQAFPSERSIDLLRGLGIDLVVWHWDWVEEERRAEYEERLVSAPGLSLEREFGNEAVYRVERGDTASPEELDVSLVSPRTVPVGEGFNLGLTVKNGGENPFLVAEEDPQPFLLSFLDPGGDIVYEERGDYRAPFFLEPGEETSLPLKVKGTPGEGTYRIRLELQGGVLEQRSFEQDLKVRNPQDLEDRSILDGGVYLKGDSGTVEIPVPDGLYPLVLRVDNTGGTLRRSDWEEK